ncbi:MAG: alpha/beta hydrolase [Kibdelosporangium sp.]
MIPKRVAILIAAVLTVGPLTPALAVEASARLVAQADAAPTPSLTWAGCTEPGLERFECATADVPLDYDRPRGPKLGLAVLRQRATGDKIGTLFTAVGGPGGSGVDSARAGMPGGELAQRFDVVTFDQRGIGRSRQIRCFETPERQTAFWSAATLPPAGPAEERNAEYVSRELAKGCAEHSPDLVGNLTTVDAARDMDLLRRAVGDEKLTYTGGSYASYLGEVYGALFGDRVRALQLNAMIDPESYTNDPLAMLWERSTGTEGVFHEFARLCAQAGRPACAFAGPTTQDVLTRNATLLDTLRRNEIVVGTGESAITLQYRDIIPLHAQLLYDTENGWPALAWLLEALELGPAGNAEIVRQILDAVGFRLDFLDSLVAISCADVAVVKAPGAWPALAKAFDAHVPHYGRHWLYLLQPCAAWAPSPQRHTGPWRLKPGTPALLINNRYDPVTALSFAEKAQRRLGNARLVVVEGHGHDIRGACTQRLRDRYLVDLEVPAPGTTCRPDRQPFA